MSGGSSHPARRVAVRAAALAVTVTVDEIMTMLMMRMGHSVETLVSTYVGALDGAGPVPSTAYWISSSVTRGMSVTGPT